MPMPKKKMTLREWEDRRLELDEELEIQEDFDLEPPDDNISIDEDGVAYYGR